MIQTPKGLVTRLEYRRLNCTTLPWGHPGAKMLEEAEPIVEVSLSILKEDGGYTHLMWIPTDWLVLKELEAIINPDAIKAQPKCSFTIEDGKLTGVELLKG